VEIYAASLSVPATIFESGLRIEYRYLRKALPAVIRQFSFCFSNCLKKILSKNRHPKTDTMYSKPFASCRLSQNSLGRKMKKDAKWPGRLFVETKTATTRYFNFILASRAFYEPDPKGERYGTVLRKKFTGTDYATVCNSVAEPEPPFLLEPELELPLMGGSRSGSSSSFSSSSTSSSKSVPVKVKLLHLPLSSKLVFQKNLSANS